MPISGGSGVYQAETGPPFLSRGSGWPAGVWPQMVGFQQSTEEFSWKKWLGAAGHPITTD